MAWGVDIPKLRDFMVVSWTGQNCTREEKRLPGGFVDEGDGRGADNTESQWEEESHQKDHERVEAAELVLAEREEGDEGGADVNADGGKQAPDEHLVPNFWK